MSYSKLVDPICIYHGGCDDGFGAAYAVWKHYGEKFEYYPGIYQTDPPDTKGRDVLLVDFSYKRPVIEKIAAVAKSVTIVDHHKSAMEDLVGLDGKHSNIALEFDMERSGAALAWLKFQFDHPMPDLIRHIEDRDLWRFDLPGTMLVSMALRSYPQDFKTWDSLMNRPIAELKAEGESIHRWYRVQLENLKKATIWQTIGGYEVPTVNAQYMFASDLAGELAEENSAPFAACFWDNTFGRTFSLRSRYDFDVSEIAKQYGGGGHRNAAGFKVSNDRDALKETA